MTHAEPQQLKLMCNKIRPHTADLLSVPHARYIHINIQKIYNRDNEKIAILTNSSTQAAAPKNLNDLLDAIIAVKVEPDANVGRQDNTLFRDDGSKH